MFGRTAVMNLVRGRTIGTRESPNARSKVYATANTGMNFLDYDIIRSP
jgi:hypothetical protein